MVRIHVKHGCRRAVNGADGELEFLYDCETSSTIQHITQDITEIANFQLQIRQLGCQLLPPVAALLHTHRPQVIALHRALSEATSYASKEQVVHGKPLSILVLRDHIRIIATEFVVNYKLLNFQDSNFKQLLSDSELLQEDTVQLLWAGKELMKGKTLRDYIGKNEKTKIMLRLQSQVSNPAF
ncbi:unnamed protein product [Coffea canephora]|uniref:Ubiquitin-like domain-containing protein n=1 Tax=Coffea canephora TaxID=49390 RepID=A0A068TXD2_COFCA|nr:unnamed protein product [Coffea canephora]